MVAGRSLIEEKNHRPLCESNASTGFPGQRKTLSWQKKTPKYKKVNYTLSSSSVEFQNRKNESKRESKRGHFHDENDDNDKKKKEHSEKTTPLSPVSLRSAPLRFSLETNKKKRTDGVRSRNLFFLPFPISSIVGWCRHRFVRWNNATASLILTSSEMRSSLST